MIHFALAIPINKNFNEFKALNDERQDILIFKKSITNINNKWF